MSKLKKKVFVKLDGCLISKLENLHSETKKRLVEFDENLAEKVNSFFLFCSVIFFF